MSKATFESADGDIKLVTDEETIDTGSKYDEYALKGDFKFVSSDTVEDPETFVPTVAEGGEYEAEFASTLKYNKSESQRETEQESTYSEENFDPNKNYTATLTAKLTVEPYNAKFLKITEGSEVIKDKSPQVKEGLVYNGKAQELATAGTLDYEGKDALKDNCGTVMYAVTTKNVEPEVGNETAWATTVPKATNAGTTYYVWTYIKGDGVNILGTDNQAVGEQTGVTKVGKVTIAQAKPTVTAPKAKDLTYTGSAQALVTAGSTTYGKVQYAVNKNKDSAPTKGWTTSVPKETYAGTYYVWYKVDGATNWSASAAKKISVTIKEKKVALYRMYNPNSGEHFYTTSKGEKGSLVKAGWSYEGEACKVPATGTNVYRVYNPNAGDHHYTTSKAEKDNLVKLGWRDEGVAFKSGGDTPMLRLYNPNATGAGAHHYTKSVSEKNNLVKAGWRFEGTGWNVY